MSDLHAALGAVAARSPLLVASDYDGVLAPIVSNPAEAYAEPVAMAALERLAAMKNVHVALISGRTLADLRSVAGEPAGIHLLGSHGAERDDRPREEHDRSALVGVTAAMQSVAARYDGSWVEEKPAGVVFHYRDVAGHAWDDAARTVMEAITGLRGFRTMEGKAIVEVSVADTDKGDALRSFRRETGAAAVVYLGDDVTDEDAFATLTPPDVGIKVGPDPTIASHRVPDEKAAAAALSFLADVCETIGS